MPFCKRTISPKDVCKGDIKIFTELVDVCGFTLCSVLRQLSDLSRQSVSILEELEGELVSICHRSGTLENKVVGLQKHIAALACKPPPKTNTNLDSESKRTAHFQSSWQQHVNVFGSWSRPECVQELHQEAQLNLQSLLQDFEEQLYDNRVTGQTFRHPSSQSSEDTSTTLSRSPGALSNKRPEFIFLPANKQVSEDEAEALGFHARDPTCGSEHPLLGWSASLGPPVAEKPRWRLGRNTPTQLVPIDVSGDGKILGVDLIQGACSPDSSQPRSLQPSTEVSEEHQLALRKTQSDLEHSVPPSPKAPPGMMDQATLMCPSTSWNGPKGSTFSPAWSDSYNYALAPGSMAKQSPSKTGSIGGVGGGGGGGGGLPCPSQTYSGLSASSSSHSSSFASINEPSAHQRGHSGCHGLARRHETEGAVAVVPGNGYGHVDQDKRSMRSNAFKFRERSLSTPTDSGSFCSADNMYYPAQVAGPTAHEGETYALHYPSGSSEDSASTDNMSVTMAPDLVPDGRLRTRSRSISLKKPKKKPPPPVRSVSLMKNLSDAAAAGGRESHFRDGRPKSLHIPREHHLQESFHPEFLMAVKMKPDVELDPARGYSEPDASPREGIPEQERELVLPAHWPLNEWKANNDAYHSLSGSSTATGTTVIECMKVQGSSESLDSHSTSRATSPSQLSIEAEVKVSPFKPPGLMSPSSGYSSQSETPTPTMPSALNTGPSFMGCKMRPKIPERKSSLPATSPREKTARSRLSFELPSAQLDLSSVKPKPKAGRRHSDTSAASKPGKLSPSQSTLPVVTQTELRNIRLRSVSRSELDDSPDGASDIIEEEQGRDLSPPCTPDPKPPKPPVAMKPPLPKRPINLMFKSPSSSPLAPESPPASPVDRPMPVGNIYMVVRKPKPKRPPQSPVSPLPSANQEHQSQSYLPALLPELDLEHGIPIEEEEGPPSPSSPEKEDRSKTLPSHMTISCLAELDKRRPKVPPPVPKKPSVLLLPSPSSAQTNGIASQQLPPSNSDSECPVSALEPVSEPEEVENPVVEADTPKDSTPPSDVQTLAAETVTVPESPMEANSSVGDKNELHITEETEDDVLTPTPTTHTTEDLFTIIHRSKRKVLGRKEPVDSFGSRQSLISPVKSNSSDHLRTLTLGSTPRSSLRNENFMALLQKKGSKSSSGTRVSAMELLKSTNPLARRVTEFSQPDPDSTVTNPSKPLED
ncbi:NHS-like protein 2 isoform X2 [Alosa sapidissima]|uniref:NHS-like protein 2 isoform X2 n=1 Tax=Alosa sapidissima TaxID=34773 RepID=UPI001C083DF5|nr:NHS-like protein 2 isoform X2 [Alosa sapidissima]